MSAVDGSLSDTTTPLKCTRVISCPTTYELTSNVGSKKINVISYTNSRGTLSQCQANSASRLTYNPCPNNANSCCKEIIGGGTTETYSPVNAHGICESKCLQWSMVVGASPKEWEYEEITIGDGASCPTPPANYSNSSYYTYDTAFDSLDRCLQNEIPIFYNSFNGIINTCESPSDCTYSEFVRVRCSAPDIYGEVIDVKNNELSTLCSQDILPPPTYERSNFSSVFNANDWNKFRLTDESKNRLSNDLCKVFNLGIGSDLKVVVGTEQDYAGTYQDLDQYYILSNLPLSVSQTENYDDYFGVIGTELVSNILNSPDYDSANDGIFGKWKSVSRTMASDYLSTTDYFILSDDLTRCQSFYDSAGVYSDTNNSEDQTYDIVEFTEKQHPYVRKTCPVDPFYSNINDKTTACLDITHSGGPPSKICCVSNYAIENSNYKKPSTDYELPKECSNITATPCSLLPISDKDISSIPEGGYICGNAKNARSNNILNDQGVSNLINMYPGYDYQYINYASTTHAYYNGDHSANDTPSGVSSEGVSEEIDGLSRKSN
jgi:hypothetical protein